MNVKRLALAWADLSLPLYVLKLDELHVEDLLLCVDGKLAGELDVATRARLEAIGTVLRRAMQDLEPMTARALERRTRAEPIH